MVMPLQVRCEEKMGVLGQREGRERNKGLVSRSEGSGNEKEEERKGVRLFGKEVVKD